MPMQQTNQSWPLLAVSGITPLTTLDFPEHLAAVLYTQGCPLRCVYCHNPHLLESGPGQLDWAELWQFLRQRQDLLEAVVISGGEPLQQPGLADALATIKSLGYKLGLHTAGTHPKRLQQVLPLLDWIGLDVKAPAEYYQLISGRPRMYLANQHALQQVLEAADQGLAYEVRTSVAWGRLPLARWLALAEQLSQAGVANYVWQDVRSTSGYQALPGPTPQQRVELMAYLRTLFTQFSWRNG